MFIMWICNKSYKKKTENIYKILKSAVLICTILNNTVLNCAISIGIVL